MKKIQLVLLSLIFLTLILILSLLITISISLTGNIIKSQDNEIKYMHTKAICNSTNFCQDYIITCIGNKTISKNPITGAVVQHDKDWIDPRVDKDMLC